jgi:hypothetical protein
MKLSRQQIAGSIPLALIAWAVPVGRARSLLFSK